MSIVKSFSFPEGEIRGDMFYIKHGSNNFTVIDCFLSEGDGANDRMNEIIQEIKHESANRICRFISTHPDNDHIKGIEKLDEEWEILNFYAVNNSRPADKDDASLTRYQWLLANKNYEIKRGIKRKWLNDKDSERGSSGLHFLWPDLDNAAFKKALKSVSVGNDINDICPILVYSIDGGAKFMWMGDLETGMQQAYYDEYKDSIPQVDILFHPHHGRKSGEVPEELMKALNPKIVVVGNAPAKDINYGDSSKTITQNSAGDILFENEDNEVHVYTKNKITNKPTCLWTKLGKRNKLKGFSVDWYYAGTLTV